MKLEEYEKLGRPEEIEEVMSKTLDLIEKVKELKKENRVLRHQLEEYHELGTPEELSEVLTKVENKLTRLRAFEETYGSLDEVAEVIDIFESSLVEVTSEEIAEGLGVTTDAVLKLYNESKSFDSVIEILSSLQEDHETEEVVEVVEAEEVTESNKAVSARNILTLTERL